MKTRNIGLVMLLVIGLPLAAFSPAKGATIDLLRGKIALEAQIEERVRAMLSSYLNTKDIAVAAKVNLLVKKNDAEAGGGSVRTWDEKEELVLPGVPAAASMTKDNTAAAAAEAIKKQIRLGVSSINIWVIVGKQLPKDQEAKIKTLITDALDLRTDYGDTLVIESSPPEKAARSVNIGAIVALICLVVLAVFLYGPLSGFLKHFNDNIAALATAAKGPAEHKAGSGGDDEIAGETTMSGALNISGGGGGASVLTFDSGENMPLDKYVTKDNVDDLMLILHDESPEVIARVVQRIPQKLAYEAIPKYRMTEVLAQFLKREFDDPEKIKNMMNRIKDKMAGSFGGEVRLGNLMQVMDKKSQNRALAFLREKDAAFAAAVETHFFKFDDLLRYDEMAIRRIFRKAGAEPFARCLKNCDAPTAEAFCEMLGPAIKDLVTARLQNMLVTGDTNESELSILNAVNALVEKGFILPLADVKQAKS